MTDEEYMKIAIDLSKKSKYPYGAIIVKEGKIIGRSDAQTKINKSIFHKIYFKHAALYKDFSELCRKLK